MKILYVLPETHIFGGGGIATYLRNASRALSEAGHDVFILTWDFTDRLRPDAIEDRYVKASHIRKITIDGEDVWKRFPNGPWHVAFSHYFSAYVEAAAREFKPDVLETSDYQAPLFGFLARRRAGLLPDLESICIASFNHGLQSELSIANAAFPDANARHDMAAERTMLQWSDIVLAPSETALKRLQRQIGHCDHIALLREPYYPEPGSQIVNPDRKIFTFLGRISFMKGLDHAVHFLNVANSIDQVERADFIGDDESTTFSTSDPKHYVRERIGPELWEKLRFRGRLSNEDVLRHCRAGGYSLNFSLSETFNYVFLEQLDGGLVPYTLDDTAMAEFYPNEERSHLIGRDFRLDDLEQRMNYFAAHGRDHVSRLTDFAGALTNPRTFAERYEAALEAAVRSRGDRIARPRTTYSGADVTVLVYARNPDHRILDAIDSVRRQSEPAREIVVLDDGTHTEEGRPLIDRLAHIDDVHIIHSTAYEGVCSARSKLIDHCKTELAILLDENGWLEPDFIAATLDVMTQSCEMPSAVVTWSKKIGSSEELIVPFNLDDHVRFLDCDLPVTGMIKTEALRAIGFRPSRRNGEAYDWEFWLKFKESGRTAVSLPILLHHRRATDDEWPGNWSEGRAILFSDLLTKRLRDALDAGTIGDDALLDLVCREFRARSTVQGLNLEIRALKSEIDRLQAIEQDRNVEMAHTVNGSEERKPKSGADADAGFDILKSIAHRLRGGEES